MATKGMACLGAADRRLGRCTGCWITPGGATAALTVLAPEREVGSELLLARIGDDRRQVPN
ncbi:MAG: hypothetical protein ACRDNS_20345 [Trebonia sp.]